MNRAAINLEARFEKMKKTFEVLGNLEDPGLASCALAFFTPNERIMLGVF